MCVFVVASVLGSGKEFTKEGRGRGAYCQAGGDGVSGCISMCVINLRMPLHFQIQKQSKTVQLISTFIYLLLDLMGPCPLRNSRQQRALSLHKLILELSRLTCA